MKSKIYVVKGNRCFGIFLSYNLLEHAITKKHVVVEVYDNIGKARIMIQEYYGDCLGFSIGKIKVNKIYFISAKTGEICGLA